MSGVVMGDDGVARCPWAVGSPMMREYHDTEWGVPVRGEQALFERVCLEGFQAGLSWAIILARREGFRRAFDDFDPDLVAAYTDAQLEDRLTNPGIIRNRAKVFATRSNAQAALALRDAGGLDELIWSHQPPPGQAPASTADLVAVTDASTALSKSLRRAGFRFVGPTTAYALMQAVGLVDDHLVGCHRRG